MANYNPYENMLNTLDQAAEKLGLTRNDYEVIRHPEREMQVAVPVQMDDGHIEVSAVIVRNIVQLWAPLKVVSVSILIPMKTKFVLWQLG